MVWMTSFCFCCSVRLGVICTALLSMVFKLGELLIFALYGQEIVPEIVKLIEKNPELKDNFILKGLTDYMKRNSDDFVVHVIIDSSFHILACLLCVYGTYKLKKWFILPYIITQFVFTIRALFVLITSMLIIKKDVNLGILIGITITGGFIVLLLGYQWSGGVGMYQIIKLVKSPKYKQMYGDDPFYPIDLISPGSDSVENIKIFTTPNYDEVDNLKSLNAVAIAKQKIQNRNMNNNNNFVTINHHNNDDNGDLRNFWCINELAGYRKINRHDTIGYF